MKQCPKCRQLFTGEDLRFCRFDGSSLTSEVTSPDEVATIRFPVGHVNNRSTPPEDLGHGRESRKTLEVINLTNERPFI